MIKKGDFVQLHYTGKLEDGRVFDTTVQKEADEAGLTGTQDLTPITICVGEGMLLRGLDSHIEGKEVGKHTFDLKPNEAFGKKDPKLLRVIPTEQLRKQKINPVPGLELNVDGNYGIVRNTGGGRTTVDFNHPLASQNVTYDVEILKKVDDPVDQVRAIIGPVLPASDITVKEKNVTIHLQQLPPQHILDVLQERITTLTGLKTVSFERGKKNG